jgi:hypothetical protein
VELRGVEPLTYSIRTSRRWPDLGVCRVKAVLAVREKPASEQSVVLAVRTVRNSAAPQRSPAASPAGSQQTLATVFAAAIRGDRLSAPHRYRAAQQRRILSVISSDVAERPIRPAMKLLLAALPVAIIAFAVPAHADSNDTAFLKALRASNESYCGHRV